MADIRHASKRTDLGRARVMDRGRPRKGCRAEGLGVPMRCRAERCETESVCQLVVFAVLCLVTWAMSEVGTRSQFDRKHVYVESDDLSRQRMANCPGLHSSVADVAIGP